MSEPRLQLRDRGARWLVSGLRVDEPRRTFVTISGAVEGGDVRLAEVPADTLYGQTLYSYGDGTTLVASVTRPLRVPSERPSLFRTYLTVLSGGGVGWTISRYERQGNRAMSSIRGYPSCAGTLDGDVAVCVEQWRRASRLWSIPRSGDPVDLGRLPSRYDRVRASPGGHVVGSSIDGRSVAVVDVAHRRGVRTSIPAGHYDYVRELTATNGGVVAVFGGPGGMRMAVYRLDPAAGEPAVVAR
jgi:hypothetical protein